MCRVAWLVLAGLISIGPTVGGCGWGRSTEQSNCEPVALDSAIDLDASDNVIPTPEDNTWLAIAIARDWMQEYRDSHDCRLPATVKDLVWQPPAVGVRRTPQDTLPKDGWGRRLIYRRWGESFEFRSAGADAVLDTPDDVAFSWHPRSGRE